MKLELVEKKLRKAFWKMGLETSAVRPGIWQAGFGPTGDRPAVNFQIALKSDGKILSMIARPGVAYAEDLRLDLLEATNRWHADKRWPRLHVENEDDSLMVVADWTTILSADHYRAKDLAHCVATFIASCLDFWSTFHRPAGDEDMLAGFASLMGQSAAVGEPADDSDDRDAGVDPGPG